MMRADEIAFLLPEIYRDARLPGGVLDTILAVMERLHEPVEDRIARFDEALDPYRAPDAFVELMAHWLALGHYLDRDRSGQRGAAIRPAALRDLVAFAAQAARLRGTADTIILFLTRATGIRGFAIEENPLGEDAMPQPFHIRVWVPRTAADQMELIRRIVMTERPAYVTFELHIEEA